MVNRNTGQKFKGNEAKKMSAGELTKIFSDKHLIMPAQSNCNAMEFLDSQISAIEKLLYLPSSHPYCWRSAGFIGICRANDPAKPMFFHCCRKRGTINY